MIYTKHVFCRNSATCEQGAVRSDGSGPFILVLGGAPTVAVALRRGQQDVPMKVSEIVRQLHEDGWFLVSTKGSHRQFKHRTKVGRVTVAGKPSDDLAPGTQNSILQQAGLKQLG